MKIKILLIIIFISFQSFSQKDTIIYSGDTVNIYYYYSNGNIRQFEKQIKGRDWLSYRNFTYYFENGKVEWSNYYDSKIDSSFSIKYHKNGMIKYFSYDSKRHWETVEYDKKGIIKKKTYRNIDLNENYYIIDHYKKGAKKNTIEKYYKHSKKKILDTIKYYQNDTIKNQQVIIVLETNIDSSYTVNNLKLSKAEYALAKNKYDKYSLSRSKKHWYQEYTSDSILVLEGLFSDFDKCIGVYKEYYPDGVVKIRGYYDKKGRKDGTWRFFMNDGRYYMKAFYVRGFFKMDIKLIIRKRLQTQNKPIEKTGGHLKCYV